MAAGDKDTALVVQAADRLMELHNALFKILTSLDQVLRDRKDIEEAIPNKRDRDHLRAAHREAALASNHPFD